MKHKALKTINQNTSLGIFVIWLFNTTALLGIGLGYQDWFMGKTLLNMGISLFFLALLLPIKTLKNWSLFAACFFIGMASEWIGVHTGFLFGNYYYGENLGFKIFEVPFFIGINWAILSIASAQTLSPYIKNKYGLALLAALLMVVLDVFMEMAAPGLDFWYFSAGVAPFKNYLTWFIVALLIQLFIIPKIKENNSRFATHLMLSQMVFFIGYLLL